VLHILLYSKNLMIRSLIICYFYAFMKYALEIYRHTFKHKSLAVLTIICNLLFVIFNLLSLVLFIPFLQLIFPKDSSVVIEPVKPIFHPTLSGIIEYVSSYYSYFMETMVLESPKNALIFVCLSVLVAFFLKNLFRYGAIWYQSQLRMVVIRDIRQNLFNKAISLPLAYHTSKRKGDLMARIQSDVLEIELAVIAILELFFREPIAVLLNVIALLYWSPKLTLFSFVLMPITAFVISKIGKSLKRTAGKERQELSLLYSKMEESLGGIRIIKAFNAQKFIRNSFASTNLRYQQLSTKSFRKRDLSSPLNEFFSVAVMLSIVWYGGVMILDGVSTDSLDGPKFIGFILIFSQMLRPVQGISQSIAILNKATVSQQRINEILDTDEQIYEVENPVSKASFTKGIDYKNVSFSYEEKLVLKNISFTIPKGKTLALVGESGSGKSTISDLLPRFYDVDSGAIFIDDTDIRTIKIADLRHKIGIVSQESILFNGTIAENIAFGKLDATPREIIAAAKIANAHNFIKKLENRYDTHIGEGGNKLSGGQKQRIAIARAVLKNPDILILDEATSALDTESEKLVQEALNKLMSEDKTVLVIAHRLSTVKSADNIIVLSEGEIAEQGTHEELIQKNGIYAYLSSLQGIFT